MTQPRRVARYGWIPDLPDRRDRLVEPLTEARRMLVSNTPTSDLSVSPFMPPVWDQGQLGSCTAHSVGGAYSFAAAASGAPNEMPSRLYIYYHERLIEGTVGQDAGAMIRDGFKVLAAGVPPETDWPYDITKFTDAPPAQAETDAKTHPTTVYSSVPQTDVDIKAILIGDGTPNSGRPVSCGFSVYESFESAQVAQTGVVPMPGPNEGVIGGHAIDIVGHDDVAKRFKGRNSWNKSWGMGGYFTIPYAYYLNPDLASDFWVATVAA